MYLVVVVVALRLYFGDIIHTHSYPPPMWDGRRSTAVDPYIAPDSESDTGEYLLATYLVLIRNMFPGEVGQILGGSNRNMHLPPRNGTKSVRVGD